jgi:hypothetical protein
VSCPRALPGSTLKNIPPTITSLHPQPEQGCKNQAVKFQMLRFSFWGQPYTWQLELMDIY